MRLLIRSLAVSVASLPLALAQTSSSCNPLKSSCPADPGLANSSLTTDFTSLKSLPPEWTATSSPGSISYSSRGATFSIAQSGESPTISTSFYMLFGSISVIMTAAPGTGIVSSIVLESDCLDEIDWEWLGGNTAQVQSNYFGKGNTTSYDRAVWSPVSSPQSSTHNYTVDWREDGTDWLIDGAVIRTLKAADALAGQNYPQTPMKLKIGNWAGGDTNANAPGTVSWAGGATDFSKGPFAMVLRNVEIRNKNPAGSYSYGDRSGSWQSIKKEGANAGTSSASPNADTGKPAKAGVAATAISAANSAAGVPAATALAVSQGTGGTATSSSGLVQTSPTTRPSASSAISSILRSWSFGGFSPLAAFVIVAMALN